jgi:23S rRNA (uridine2552-2'-O)-methyltransferase
LRLDDARRDYYRRLAKEKGYKSRAAFKLTEASKRYQLIKKGDRVIDFGAAPGGWVQVASELVGPKGLVVAVDLLPVKLGLGNVRSIQSDVQDSEMIEKLREFIPGQVDVILSDIAPQVSGAWDLDHYRQVELTLVVMRLARLLLRKGGNAMVKVFQGEIFLEVSRSLKEMFEFVAITKPKASRMKSSELYLVCLRSR